MEQRHNETMRKKQRIEIAGIRYRIREVKEKQNEKQEVQRQNENGQLEA